MADNLKDINCPACGEKMIKVFMPSANLHLDVCTNGCGGIYFDNREFSKFDEPNEDISPVLEALTCKEFKKVDQSLKRKCPVCGTFMVKNFANPKQEIEIDECYACGGKFLDYMELDKIRVQCSDEEIKTDDLIKKIYAEAGMDINSLRTRKKSKHFMIKGAAVGLIIALTVLYLNKGIMFSGGNKIVPVVIAAFIIGFCLIGAGLGALFEKMNNNR